jgi:hypothetical protein
MLNQFIKLQLFAEESAQETTGGTAPAAGEQQDFETLIRGPYKADFDARVQKILDGRLRALRRENESLRAAGEAQQLRAREAFAALEKSAGEVQAVYRTFDWQRELENDEFARLIAAGVAPRTAYEVMHREEILRAAMDCAVRKTAHHAARTAAQSAWRVRESGGGSAAVMGSDPRHLTSGELAEIRRRVMDGEKIRF